MKIQEIYSSLIDNQQTDDIISKANKIHGFKPFVKQFSDLYKSTEVVRFVLGAVSVLSGSYFMFQLLDIAPLLSIPFAVIVLVLIEVGKNILLQTGFALAFNKRFAAISYVMIAIGICLLSVSVIFSYIGTNRMADKVKAITLNTVSESNGNKIDSVTTLYNNQIAVLNNELTAFKESISYKGKINIHNKAVAESIQQYNDRLTVLHDRQEQALNAVIASNNNVFDTKNTKLESNKNALVFIAMLFEFGIFICLLFRSFYLYKVHSENELINSITMSENDFKEMQKMFHGKSLLDIPKIENKATIGFKSESSQSEQDRLAEMYEKEIEETENKYKIAPKPCRICLNVYQPNTKESCYCDNCKGNTSSYITMNIKRLKTFENKNDSANAEKRINAINEKIAEARNIQIKNNLYKDFY